jgi:hypothetical protein
VVTIRVAIPDVDNGSLAESQQSEDEHEHC